MLAAINVDRILWANFHVLLAPSLAVCPKMTLLVEEILMPPAAMLACECVCRALRTDQFMLAKLRPAITDERAVGVKADREGSHPAMFTTRIVGRTLNASQKVLL